MKKQSWIYSAKLDGIFILAPAFAVSAIALIFHNYFTENHAVGLWAWAFLVIGIDVAHVYSTLYRTYFDSEEFKARQALYIAIPLVGWLVFMLLYSIDSMVFWRVLAYLAVFHFMRQQYGFMMIYGRFERNLPHICRIIDKIIIYTATLYPLIYWHTKLPRDFNWFIEGDFINLPYPIIGTMVGWFYLLVIAAYIVKEVYVTRQTHKFNLPRNMLVLGTAASWYIGIVLLNSDLVFTFTNIIAHGIPYMALIWIYSYNQAKLQKDRKYLKFFTIEKFFSLQMLPIFIGLLVLFAYVEEGLWDGFVWREHLSIFGVFKPLPTLEQKELLAIIIPLLALPQITHYLLDAFIWRLKDGRTNWKKTLFLNNSHG